MAEADSGTGAFGTLSGLVVILAFLLLATDTLLELQARSTVTAVAYEAAHTVATADGPGADERARAEGQARRALGAVGAAATFDWSVSDDRISLRVRADRPGALLTALGLRPRQFDRSVTVRQETLR